MDDGTAVPQDGAKRTRASARPLAREPEEVPRFGQPLQTPSPRVILEQRLKAKSGNSTSPGRGSSAEKTAENCGAPNQATKSATPSPPRRRSWGAATDAP